VLTAASFPTSSAGSGGKVEAARRGGEAAVARPQALTLPLEMPPF
jgi:hypothetical protein